MKKYIATAIAVMGAAVTVQAQTEPQKINFAPRFQGHWNSLVSSPDGLSTYMPTNFGLTRFTNAGIFNALEMIPNIGVYDQRAYSFFTPAMGLGGQRIRTISAIFDLTPNGIFGTPAPNKVFLPHVPFGFWATLGEHTGGNIYGFELDSSVTNNQFSAFWGSNFPYSTNAANNLIGLVTSDRTGISVLQQADGSLLHKFLPDPVVTPKVGQAHSTIMSPNGSIVVGAYLGETSATWVIVFHNVTTKAEVARFSVRRSDGLPLVGAMPDNKTFVFGQFDCLYVFDIVTMTVSTIEAVNVGPGRYFNAICVPKTGNVLTMLMSDQYNYDVRATDPQLVWYDLATRKVTYRREAHTNTVFSTVVLPNGTKVFSAGKDGKLIEYGPDLKYVRVLGRSSKPINRIAASPDSTMLAVAQADQYVRVFTIATGAQKFALRGHAGQVTGVAFSPDGKLLATTGYDGYCRIYDTATGRQTRVFPKQRYGVTSVVWLSNTRLATGGWNEVKIWNLTATSGTVAATLPDQFGYVLSLAVSKAKQADLVTAKYLASGGWDGWVTCYDLGNANTKVLEQWAHTDQINSVAFTADDARLLTASDDSLMGEWDHVNGLFVDYYVHNHTLPVTSLAVSPTTGLKYYSWADGTLVSAF